jgi:small subunit ribosomal protein S1
MAKLLASKKTEIAGFKKSDIVKGKITKLTQPEILIDLNGKTEAVVLEKDKTLRSTILNTVKVGDEVTVSILNPESDSGNAVVSLRRFMEEREWQKLQLMQKNQEQLTTTVSEVTKGGYVVRLQNGMNGFLPFSHTTFNASSQLSLGKTVKLYILELKRDESKIVVSQKHQLSDDEFAKVKKTYKPNQKITAMVSGVTQFGMFVSLPLSEKADSGTVDGLVHISEIAWEKVTDLTSQYKAGDSIDVVVIGFDDNAKRLDLSIKRLTGDPFTETAKQFPIDTQVKGIISKISGGNIHVKLADSNVEGVIKKEKVPPTMTFEEGAAITVIVSEIDARHRSINLVPHLLKKTIGYR